MPGEPIVGESLALSPVEVAPDHDVRAVLRITPFRRLWLALALSSFGDWLGLLAIAAMAQTLAGDSYAGANFAVAGVFLLRLAPAVLLGPVAGALADRLNRKFTLVAGDVARALLFVSIPLVGTLEWLFVATILIECFALFWMPAKDATVPNLVPRNRLEAANQISLVATYGTAPFAAVAFSGVALLNGILDNSMSQLEAKPVDLALYIDALTFFVAALTVANLRIPAQTVDSRVQEQSLFRTIIDGWRFVGTTPLVRGVVVGMLGAFAAAGFVIGLAVGFVRDLGAGQPGFGVLFGAVFVGLAAGMWSGPRLLRGFSRRRLFGLSIMVAGVFLVALALVPNIVMATIFTLGLGAGGGIAWVTGYTLLGLEVDDEVRGRTFAFLQSAARVVLVLVLGAGPALAAVIGPHTFRFTEHFALDYNGAAFVFLLAGLIAITVGVLAYRQMDDRRGTSLRADLAAALSSVASAGQVGEDRPAHPYAGTFIVIEGGDGAGKSTQARLLAEWLRTDQQHDVLLTREPGATPLGSQLRSVLLDPEQELDPRTEALLFAADRSHHVESMIRPALERGAIVVSDRYVDSSIAYQGSGRALDAEAVARLSRWATRSLVPDLTVLIDVPGELAVRRRASDRERTGDDRLESESTEFHERVRARFLELARREPHRYLVLDADLPVEELHRAVAERVRDLVPISPRRRAELARRLDAEEAARQRRAEAEARILRLDAELRARRHDEERERQEKQRAARAEVERQLMAEISAEPDGAEVEAGPETGSETESEPTPGQAVVPAPGPALAPAPAPNPGPAPAPNPGPAPAPNPGPAPAPALAPAPEPPAGRPGAGRARGRLQPGRRRVVPRPDSPLTPRLGAPRYTPPTQAPDAEVLSLGPAGPGESDSGLEHLLFEELGRPQDDVPPPAVQQPPAAQPSATPPPAASRPASKRASSKPAASKSAASKSAASKSAASKSAASKSAASKSASKSAGSTSASASASAKRTSSKPAAKPAPAEQPPVEQAPAEQGPEQSESSAPEPRG